MKGLINKLPKWVARQFFHHDSVGGYFEPVIQMFKPSWRTDHYRAKVQKYEFISKNTIALTLQVDSSWPSHIAGQHVELTLEVEGKLVTRVFTIASSSVAAYKLKQIRLVIKVQADGLLTNRLQLLNVGDWLNISKAYGEFNIEKLGRTNLFLAAGSGITPFISMLAELTDTDTIDAAIHLIYYAKADEHLLVDELDDLSQQLSLFTYELVTRTVHGELSEHLDKYKGIPMFVCGPGEFFKDAASFAKTNNIELNAEHFSLVDLSDTEKAMFDVSLNGKKLAVDNTSSILNQLLKKGESVNHGCKIGVCHQCQCTKKSGVVKDIRTGRLSDRGEELIQLCVSQVLTDLELEA